MTDADAEMIAELQRLNAERTQGEWFWREDKVSEDDSIMHTLAPGVLILDDDGGGPWGDSIDRANAAFIVAAVNAIPRLLSLAKEAQAARAEAERLREALNDLTMNHELAAGIIAGVAFKYSRHDLAKHSETMRKNLRAIAQEQRDD